jgi:hypothetical protein
MSQILVILVIESDVPPNSTHKYSAMVFWPVVRSLHRFCKRSWSWTCNIYNFKLEIFNVCMFIIISLWFDILHMLFVIWPVVRSLHRFCKRSWSWTCLCWVRLAGGLPTTSCWIIVRTVASSCWHHSMTRHIDGWAGMSYKVEELIVGWNIRLNHQH